MEVFWKKNRIIFGILSLILIFAGIHFSQTKFLRCKKIPFLENNAEKLVTKVIDGDTFLIEGGYPVRILGIDTDEKGEPCYFLAKERLEELILNKKVRLEKGSEDFDKYCRYLRYVFLGNENIGEKLIAEGLAVARLDLKDEKYKNELIEAEKRARESKTGCKWEERKVEKENENWRRLNEEKTNKKVIPACEAKNFLGQEMIVEGKVAEVYVSKKNNVFLNFERPYPNQCFSAVIFSENLKNFKEDPQKFYLKKVRILGKIKEYRGKPQIILENQNQIEGLE
jgi:micrococcal nuclease